MLTGIYHNAMMLLSKKYHVRKLHSILIPSTHGIRICRKSLSGQSILYLGVFTAYLRQCEHGSLS